MPFLDIYFQTVVNRVALFFWFLLFVFVLYFYFFLIHSISILMCFVFILLLVMGIFLFFGTQKYEFCVILHFSVYAIKIFALASYNTIPVRCIILYAEKFNIIYIYQCYKWYNHFLY